MSASSPATYTAQTETDVGRLHVVVVGHVDHGKSTFVGRLLHDTESLPEGKIEQVKKACAAENMDFEYAFLLDALLEEQEQNITIDTTRIFFRTKKRNYAIIDAPGHREFLKNMVTGAASASAALLVIDAQEGVMDQSRRHAVLLSLLGVKQLVVLVNKMDLVKHDAATFQRIETEYTAFLASLGLKAARFIPIAARHGDNVVTRSQSMAWYKGPTVAEGLDDLVHVDNVAGLPLRMPVSDIYRFDHRRIIAGRVESGSLRPGEPLVFLPGGRSTTVRAFEDWPITKRDVVPTGASAGFTLEEQIFVERGQIAAHPSHAPRVGREFRARIFWLGREPLALGRSYRLRLGTQDVPAFVSRIHSITDADTLASTQGESVPKDAVADIVLRTAAPIAYDLHHECPVTGRFAIEDGERIAGGGIITEEVSSSQTTGKGRVTPAERIARHGHGPAILWFTGLSGSGKSTLSESVERRLFDSGKHVLRVDGDELRSSLSRDLAFTPEARAESVRRAAAVAGLFADTGAIVLVTLIAPLAADREKSRRALARHAFLEVFVDAPLSVCESRDPKGLYAKVRRGEIREFTGISSPYEAPQDPEVHVRTDQVDLAAATEQVLAAIDAAVREPREDWEV
jgi:bifunctional enzyme CysN/CysC